MLHVRHQGAGEQGVKTGAGSFRWQGTFQANRHSSIGSNRAR